MQSIQVLRMVQRATTVSETLHCQQTKCMAGHKRQLRIRVTTRTLRVRMRTTVVRHLFVFLVAMSVCVCGTIRACACQKKPFSLSVLSRRLALALLLSCVLSLSLSYIHTRDLSSSLSVRACMSAVDGLGTTGHAKDAELIEATYGLAGVDGNEEFQRFQDEIHHRTSMQSDLATDTSDSEPEPALVNNIPAPSPYTRPEKPEEGIYGLGPSGKAARKESEDTYGLAKATDEGTYGLGYAPQPQQASDAESDNVKSATGGYGLAKVADGVGDGDSTYGQQMRQTSEL